MPRRLTSFNAAKLLAAMVTAAFDNVNLTPTAVLINRNGRVLGRILGEPDFTALNALIDKELAR